MKIIHSNGWRMEGHTLIMPYDYVGKLLTVMQPDGKTLMSIVVGEPAEVELNFPNGIYIINIGGKSYKIGLR